MSFHQRRYDSFGDGGSGHPSRGADRAFQSEGKMPRDGSGLGDNDAGSTGEVVYHIHSGSRRMKTWDGKLAYLSTVKQVQLINRRDRFRKSRSARTLTSTSDHQPQQQQQQQQRQRGDSSLTGPSSPGERQPLKVAFRQSSAAAAPADFDDDLSFIDLTSRGPMSTVAMVEEGTAAADQKNDDKDGIKHDVVDDDKDDDAKKADDIPRMTTCQAIWEMITGKGIVSACLLVTPFALASVYLEWGATWIFWLNFVVMIPLAAILGDFTEEVALHTNETIGGLINASFGNAVEVVVAIQALLANEIRVVQASMLGSIFSNLLLVLGSCFFFGGMCFKEQTFNPVAASANMGLLAVSSIAMILPTPLAQYYQLHDAHVLQVSRISALFLLSMYIQLLLFQLKTHAHLFNPPDSSTSSEHFVVASSAADNGKGADAGNATPSPLPSPRQSQRELPPPPTTHETRHEEDDHDAEDEMPVISLCVACFGLLITTLLVTVFSEFLVGSIDGFVESSGISRTFVGIIILPIVGNAVEHVTAVTVAMKDKMDLAMGVAVGSCTQISLFVVPLTVLVGWAFGKDMTLNFPQFEVVLFVMSVFTVSIVLANPTCNWLEGSMLVTTYILIAVGFWFENVMDFK